MDYGLAWGFCGGVRAKCVQSVGGSQSKPDQNGNGAFCRWEGV